MLTILLAAVLLGGAALTPILLRLMEKKVLAPKGVALLAGGLALMSLSIWAFMFFGPRDYQIVWRSWTGLPVDYVHPYMLGLYSLVPAFAAIFLLPSLAVRFFRLRKR
jgi:hypothetical protein